MREREGEALAGHGRCGKERERKQGRAVPHGRNGEGQGGGFTLAGVEGESAGAHAVVQWEKAAFSQGRERETRRVVESSGRNGEVPTRW